LLDKRARYSESRHCLVFEGSGVQSDGNNLLKFISLARHYSLLDQEAARAHVAHLSERDLLRAIVGMPYDSADRGRRSGSGTS